MPYDDQVVIERYHSLKQDCLENPVFQSLLDQVKQDILASVTGSPEAAVAAHYELKALERLRGKLTSTEINYEDVIRREQAQ